jgi:uncharacterized surface protein with fasciclin (FAS1) repeats
MGFAESFLLLLPLILRKVDAQTVADLIRTRPGLSRAWAAQANHPEWSGPGPVTVFLPTDAALAAATLPAGSLGSLTVNQAINYLTTVNYQILTDSGGVVRMVYDNYRGGQAVPEIHCRFGTGEALTLENLNATNGWLYTLNRAIEAPLPLSQNLQRNNGFTQFLASVDRAGMRAELDAMRDITVLAFTDSATGIAQLANLTPAQLRVVILSHIVPAVRYSVALDTTIPMQTLNTGYSLRLTIGTDSVQFNGASVYLADVMISNGVIHQITQVLIPTNLPPATFSSQTTSAQVTTTTTATTTTTSNSKETSEVKPLTPVTDSKSTSNLNNASGQTVPGFYLGLAILSILYFAL